MVYSSSFILATRDTSAVKQRGKSSITESGIFCFLFNKMDRKTGSQEIAETRCGRCALQIISFFLMLSPLFWLWMKKTQLEILSFIFDKMVFWILFVWNILLAAFLIFLGCENTFLNFLGCKKNEKSAEEELKSAEEELLPDGLIEEMAGEKKENGICLSSRRCVCVLHLYHTFNSPHCKIDFGRIFAFALILGTVFVYTVLLIAIVAYQVAITDYMEKVMIGNYATSNNENISSFNVSVSVDSAIDASRIFCIGNICLYCLAACLLLYIIYVSTNKIGFHSMTLMAVFYMFVNGWFLIATAYLVGERDGSQHIMAKPICGFIIGLIALALICFGYEQGKIQERCLTLRLRLTWLRLTWYKVCGSILFVVLVANFFVLHLVVLSSASAVALAHHLYRSICWVTYEIMRCRNKDIQQDDFNMSVGMVSMLVYFLLLFVIAMHIYVYDNYLYISLMMIFLGISINILGSVIYSKIESRDILRENAAVKARQVAIYCIRCAIFAFFVNCSASFFFFLFTKYSRNSIIHMSDETYFRKTRETNWKGRSKEDFINALESDLWFYSYYSLASLILVTYAGFAIYLWRKKLNFYEEI